MNPLSIVIPSKTESNLVVCVREVLNKEPNSYVVVVDDFPAGERPVHSAVLHKVQWREGIHPFVFARNINLGIAGCQGRDVVLMNDDAILETFGGLKTMQKVLEDNPEYGLLGANYTPERQLKIIDAPYMVPFICVLIPRRTIEIVGMLDERFTGYGYEDDDYCLRVRRAGMKVGTYTGCYVNHNALRSTYRVASSRPPGLSVAREIFCQKWGSHPL